MLCKDRAATDFFFYHTMDKQALIEKIQGLDGLTNDEKSDLLGLLRAHKKYGLVWEDKPEDVEERLRDELPVLTEVKERALVSSTITPPNHPTTLSLRVTTLKR